MIDRPTLYKFDFAWRKATPPPVFSSGGIASFQETPSSGPAGFGPAYLQDNTSVKKITIVHMH